MVAGKKRTNSTPVQLERELNWHFHAEIEARHNPFSEAAIVTMCRDRDMK